MISIQTLSSQLKKCPVSAELKLINQEHSFIQPSAVEQKYFSIQHQLNSVKSKNGELDYTIHSNNSSYEKTKTEHNFNNEVIANESLLMITENSTLDLPEIILTELNGVVDSRYYIYGIKNPDSLYKSILLLTKPDFIIKNRNNRKNDILTFKKELSIHYDMFYKKFKYRQYKVNKVNLLNSLLNEDNYHTYDIMLYIADYLNSNILVIDIINFNYFSINNINNNLISQDKHENLNSFYVLIKYSNDTFLPLMNSEGGHFINSDALNKLVNSDKFSKYEFSKYTERNLNTSTNNNTCNSDNMCNDTCNNSCNDTSNNSCNKESTNDLEGCDNIVEKIKIGGPGSLDNKSASLELKSISNYKLAELQELASKYNIDTKKNGKQSKLINKSKQELYDDLQKL